MHLYLDFSQTPFRMRRLCTALLLLAAAAPLARAQVYAYPPISLSSNAGTFNATTPVENLMAGIQSGVRSATPFPYESTSSFTSPGIGYIAQYGTGTGTFAFTMPEPVTIDRVYLWNAYFTIELDHSVQDMAIRFYDNALNLVGTVTHSWPIANPAVLTGDSVMIDPPITDVSRIEADVQSLHGGNDISLRRMAFAGSTLVAGLGDARTVHAAAFPNPATDAVTVLVANARQAQLVDAAGRAVQAPVQRFADRVLIDVSALAPGSYHARITTERGGVQAQVVVGR